MTGVYFNGINSEGVISDNQSLNPETITITAWVKLATYLELQGKWAAIVSKYYTKTTPFKGYYLEMRSHDARTVFAIRDPDGKYYAVSVDEPKDLDWHFVVGSYDGETQKLYIDMKLKDQLDWSGKISVAPVPLKIGTSEFNGFIKDLRIYNIALSEDQLWEIYKNPYARVAMEHCVLWLPFTENMGVIAKDYSGNNNHARLYNCKWVSRARRGMYFDNGGMKFDSSLTIDCNYCSVVAVFAIETLARGGTPATGRNCIVKPVGDKLMLFNNHNNEKLRFTNYDGVWKEIESNIDLEAGQIYTGVGIMNGNEEHIYLASNGVIIDHNYRDDLGDCGEYTDATIYIGSRGDGKYALHGEVLAVMIYDRPITESEIERISDLGWFDPPRDGLISWILFDGLKEGDEVKDLITGAIGEPIGTPKFVIRKPKRVLAR